MTAATTTTSLTKDDVINEYDSKTWPYYNVEPVFLYDVSWGFMLIFPRTAGRSKIRFVGKMRLVSVDGTSTAGPRQAQPLPQ